MAFDFQPANQVVGAATVSTAGIDLFVLNADGTRQRKIAATTLSPLEAAKIGVSSEEISISLSFPLVGFGSVYEVEGAAVSALGIKLFRLGPAKFTEADAIAPGGARISLTVTYVGPPIPVPPVPPLPPVPALPIPVPPIPLPPLPGIP